MRITKITITGKLGESNTQQVVNFKVFLFIPEMDEII